MKTIDFSKDPHRQKHFEFFRSMAQPHFNLTAPIEIQALLAFCKRYNLSFTSTVVYLISRIANEIPSFRQRIRGDQVVEHRVVNPSFTVLTKASSVFSFCYVDYEPSLTAFVTAAEKAISKMQTAPSFEDEHGRDDFLFLSSLPWIPFTHLQHAMHIGEHTDSIPRIAWGKYTKEGTLIKMPLSVQAHHALTDGIDMGAYFEKFQAICLQPEKI